MMVNLPSNLQSEMTAAVESADIEIAVCVRSLDACQKEIFNLMVKDNFARFVRLPGVAQECAALVAASQAAATVASATKKKQQVGLQDAHARIVSFLATRAGVDLEHARFADGQTALIIAASAGRPDYVRLLLMNGAVVDGQMKDGSTALLLSALGGHTDVVSLLVAQGADVDLPADDGVTPLLVAASYDHAEVARLLLDAGADPLQAIAGGPPGQTILSMVEGMPPGEGGARESMVAVMRKFTNPGRQRRVSREI